MILGIIPARYAAQRFPGKPLADIGGKSMIQRVWEQCKQAHRLHEVVVATEDERIVAHVEAFGGKAMLTSPDHVSGTERIAEVAAAYPAFSYCVNIQGDEPCISPESINLLCEALLTPDTDIATLVRPWADDEDIWNNNLVKVVTDHQGFALYFSRSPIPHVRGNAEVDQWHTEYPFFKHLGIYGFRREVLMQVPAMKPSFLEKAESLEQLRWLANGWRVRTGITPHDSIAVDVPGDVDKVLAWLAAQPSR